MQFLNSKDFYDFAAAILAVFITIGGLAVALWLLEFRRGVWKNDYLMSFISEQAIAFIVSGLIIWWLLLRQYIPDRRGPSIETIIAGYYFLLFGVAIHWTSWILRTNLPIFRALRQHWREITFQARVKACIGWSYRFVNVGLLWFAILFIGAGKINKLFQ